MSTTNDDTAYKLTTVKSFPYRGLVEEFSNSYHFTGSMPTDEEGWHTLALYLVTAEQALFPSSVSFERAYGYQAGHNQSVYQGDVRHTMGAPAGTFAPSGSPAEAQGDSAAWVRWLTPDMTSTGKKIYLRKYFHGVYRDASDPDKLLTAQHAAFAAFGTACINTVTFGGPVICGPKGATASAPIASVWLTTRTLKRRGKRPPQ